MVKLFCLPVGDFRREHFVCQPFFINYPKKIVADNENFVNVFQELFLLFWHLSSDKIFSKTVF